MIIDYTAYEGARNKTEISFSAIGCGKTFFVMNRVCQALAHNYKQSAIDFILNEYVQQDTDRQNYRQISTVQNHPSKIQIELLSYYN